MTPTTSKYRSILLIGKWRVDPALDEISSEGKTVKLEPRAMRLLLCLAARPGQILDIQELLEEVWPGVVVALGSVYQAIAQLRRTLGDGAEQPTYIDTVSRKGYRLIASVTPWVHESLVPAQATPTDKSIAVLPFANLSADKDNEYFSDGLAEEILNALSQVEDLRVASRNSSFFFKGKATEMSEIATKLRVANVLEGSARRAGNRLRITVQLVDARNGFQLWSERYDRQMEDIFEIQDDIAKAITERLKVTLGAGAQRSTSNPEAYEIYLKGRHHWHQRSPGALHAAIRCFEEAIKLDPGYALAYAGLADCYGILRAWGWMSGEAARARAMAAMTQGITLAPWLWEVNFSRAFYILHFERAWRDAEPHFQKAIAINPRSSLAQVYYGLFLETEGRAEAAVAQTMLACRLDPLSPIVHGHASTTLNALGCFDAAEHAAQQALELQPDFILGLTNRGLALCGLGRYEEAIEPLERGAIISRDPICVCRLGFGYAQAGRPEDARRLLHEWEDRGTRGEYIPAFAPMTIHVGLGDLPAIRATFAKALAETVSPLSIRNIGHFLQPFRSDPEIDRLHRELFGW
jgi:adenylate cyclase